MVVPTKDEMSVDVDNVENRGDDEGNDSSVSNPEPEPTRPCQSGRMRCAPVPDDDTQYQRSTYNHEPKGSDSVGVTQAMVANVLVPLTYEDAMNCPDSDSWLEACMDELATLRETKTYVPVKKGEVNPHNVVGCRWVFALKKKVDGSIER